MTTEDWAKLILQSNVVAAVVVGLFGLLTLKLGIAKFASEKWWERKAAAYASVIDGLHAMYNTSHAHHDAFQTKQEIDEEYSAELSNASVSGYAEMQRGENIGAFVMTKRAASILKQLRHDIESAATIPWGEENKRRADLIYSAIAEMMVEAKRDLKT
jgi:hypothetical protein